MEHKLNRQKERIVYFDWMRIIAAIAVIAIHCCGKGSLGVTSFEWRTINFYNCLVQWAVPVFVMISGALLLGRDISFQKLFKKNILRIGTAFLFWSVLYALLRYFVTQEKHSVKEVLLTIVKGNFHMWFLFMIVGLYLVVPFLNKIVKDKKTAVYFVVLSFLFEFLFPQIINVVELKSAGIADLAEQLVSKFHVELVLGYSGYFVLGYLLNVTPISKKTEYLIYVLGLAGIAVTVVGTEWTARTAASISIFFDELTVNILLISTAVFVFAKQHLNKPVKREKSAALLSFVSGCTFGIYLVHPLIIDCFENFAGITNLSFNPIFSVPSITLAVFLLSLAVSAIIKKIPFLNKWIV